MSKELNLHFIQKLTTTVGSNIKKIRQSRGLSQSDLAKVLGITYQQVRKYETGENRISAAQLFVLSEFMDSDIEAFFTKE